MTPYGNASGHSGVRAFELAPGAITVEFAGGKQYVYDAERPGAAHVRRMQELAARGKGLATYIAQHVRERYQRRLR
jgi:hypothetical protein